MPREPLRQIWRYHAHKFFGRLFFSKYPASAILFLMDYSQQLIRSYEIPKEPPIKFQCGHINGS